MDFRFGAKSDAFREEVREFLREHLRPDMIERAHDTGTGHDWEFHRALGAQGWIAASWPEEYGGQGRDPFEMTAMRDELRLAGVPTDGLGQSIMVARTILAVGSEEQKQTFLPPFLAGEIIFGLGYTEPDSGSDVAAAKTRAVPDGDDWVIDGQKMFTTLAHEAAFVFLLARRIPTCRSTAASPCSWCRSTRPAWRSIRCTRWAANAPTRPSTRASACPMRSGSVGSTAAGT